MSDYECLDINVLLLRTLKVKGKGEADRMLNYLNTTS
jgi:hypothetical protein